MTNSESQRPNLSKEQLEELYDTLRRAYDEFGLRQMVRFGMDEDLDTIAGGANLNERVFNLVAWAVRNGREHELLQEAYRRNSSNPALQQLYSVVFSVDGTENVTTPQEPFHLDQQDIGGQLGSEQNNLRQVLNQILQHIQALHRLRHQDSVKFVARLELIEELLARRYNTESSPAQDFEVLHALNEAREELIEKEFANFLALRRGRGTDRVAKDDQRRALEWVILDSDLHPTFQDEAVKLLELVDDDNLREYIKDLYWSCLLRAWGILQLPPQLNRLVIEIGPGLPERNPFTALSAEDDSLLFNLPGINEDLKRKALRLRPKWYEKWSRQHRKPAHQRQITYVIGKTGSGKTTAALLTAYELLANVGNTRERTANTLPIYWALTPQTENLPDQLRHFMCVFARSVAAYCAMHPQSYLQSGVRQQRTMAYLFALCIGTGAELEIFFFRNRLRSSDLPEAFLKRIQQHTQNIDSRNLAHLGTEELLQLIEIALPSTFLHLVVLIDVQHNGHLNSKTTSAVRSLAETIARVSTQVHVFSPPTPQPHKDFLTNAVTEIEWTESEMQQMLSDRLIVIDELSGGTLSLLCDSRDVDIAATTTDMIKASQGSPRRLLYIGQQFIKRIEDHRRLLLQEDIDAILGSMDDNPHGH